MKKQTVYTLAVIVIVLSFFVTPLGDYSKILLNRLFSTAPMIIDNDKRAKISSYEWRLKNENWDFISFEKAKNKVVFVTFWRSWHLPSKAQLKDVQDLYDTYKDSVSFYIITNEEQEPVAEFMEKNGYTFPVTYEIVGDPSPLTLLKPPGSYVLDKKGGIAVHQTAISDWRNETVDTIFKKLISE